MGSTFGRLRAATGFGADLKILMNFYPIKDRDEIERKLILAPSSDDPALHDVIEVLRKKGERVITQLSPNSSETMPSRRLVITDGDWIVEKIKS